MYPVLLSLGPVGVQTGGVFAIIAVLLAATVATNGTKGMTRPWSLGPNRGGGAP
jgi:hypothetical protein